MDLFGTNKKIMGFRYNAPASEILEFLKKNPDLDSIRELPAFKELLKTVELKKKN